METYRPLCKNAKVAAFIVFTIAFLSHSSFSQNRFSIELRPGVHFPTETLGEANLNTGYGAEATVAYRFLPHLGIYAGWGWNKFGSDQKVDGTHIDFEETGYTYGLQFIHPVGNSKIGILIKAGGLLNHIEVEKGDEIISDSGHGFGWQVEGGLTIDLDAHWRLMPSVRYRSLNRNIGLHNITNNVDLNYLSAGLGIAVMF